MRFHKYFAPLAVASLLGVLISCSHRSGGGVTPATFHPRSPILKAASDLPTSEWPKFHKDVGNKGFTTATGPSTGNVRWTYVTGDVVRSSPAVASVSGVRTLYFGSQDDHVYALNSDGTVNWTYCPYSGSPVAGHGYDFDSTPALSVDTNGVTTVYIGCNDGKLYALQADSNNPGKGKAIWTYTTTANSYVSSSPTVGSDGSIYFGSADHKVYALNSDGSTKWGPVSTGNGVLSSPAIGSDGAVYIGSNDGKLYSLAPSNGNVNWTYLKSNVQFRSSPAVAPGSPNDTIYIGSVFGSFSKICAVNSTNGTEKWTYSLTASVYSSPAIGSDGTIYVGCDDHKVYALTDHGTYASLKWSYTTSGYVRSSPAVGDDGTVYVGSDDGYVYALNGSSGSLVWSHQVGGVVESCPAIAGDGQVFVGCDDRQLYSFAPADSNNYSVSGAVYHSDCQTGLPGVLVTLEPGGRNALTGSNGQFTIANVAPDGYSVTPQKDGYFFYPDSRGIRIFNQNVTGQYFAECKKVTGTVSVSGGGGVAGVCMKLTQSPLLIQETLTASDGTYTLEAPDGSYRVTPTKPGCTFDPAYYDVTISGSDLTGKDFTATTMPWPKFHCDEFNTGQSIYGGPTNGSLSWSYATGGALTSSPAVGSDGTIYVGSYDDYIYALNPNGTRKWRTATGDWVLSSPAIGCYDTPIVYAGSRDGYLYALYANDGTEEWTYSTGAEISSSPLIGRDGTIYVGNWNGYVYAVNPDGTELWTYQLPYTPVVSSSLALSRDGEHVYVPCVNGCMYSLSSATGQEEWGFYVDDVWNSRPFQSSNGGSLASPAVGADGTIYVGSGYYVYAVYPGGTRKWARSTGGTVKDTPAIGSSNGYIYIGSDDGYVYALNPDTGDVEYQTTSATYPFESSPAIDSNGKVYIGCDTAYNLGYVYKFNADLTIPNGWPYQTSYGIMSSPAIGPDNILYIGTGIATTSGSLLAIN